MGSFLECLYGSAKQELVTNTGYIYRRGKEKKTEHERAQS